MGIGTGEGRGPSGHDGGSHGLGPHDPARQVQALRHVLHLGEELVDVRDMALGNAEAAYGDRGIR